MALAAVNGTFAASTPTSTATTTPVAGQTAPRPLRGGFGFGVGPGGGLVDSVATYLGITQSDLHTALGNGQTLAQIAQAHGKTSADLKSYLLSQESPQIDKLLTTNFQQLQAQRPPGGPGQDLADAATFLGISQSTLQTDLQNGRTLAQVAQAQGKTVADLKTYLTSQLKTRLDKAVAANQLTSQHETTILNNASSRLDGLINGTFPAHRGPGGFGRRGGFGSQPGPGAPDATTSPTPASTN